MIKHITLFTTLLFFAQIAFSQSGITGTWKTIDDVSGKEKSYIEITEKDGKYFGTVTKLLQSPEDSVCQECDGDKKDQPIMGMVILENLETYKDYYSYGKILDPESGKEYKCSLWQDSADQLTVRGYVGISALGRSQNWYRVKM